MPYEALEELQQEVSSRTEEILLLAEADYTDMFSVHGAINVFMGELAAIEKQCRLTDNDDDTRLRDDLTITQTVAVGLLYAFGYYFDRTLDGDWASLLCLSLSPMAASPDGVKVCLTNRCAHVWVRDGTYWNRFDNLEPEQLRHQLHLSAWKILREELCTQYTVDNAEHALQARDQQPEAVLLVCAPPATDEHGPAKKKRRVKPGTPMAASRYSSNSTRIRTRATRTLTFR